MKAFKSTEEAHAHALEIDRDERDHLEYNYQMRDSLLKSVLAKISKEDMRRRADEFIQYATASQFIRECFQKWDELNGRKVAV